MSAQACIAQTRYRSRHSGLPRIMDELDASRISRRLIMAMKPSKSWIDFLSEEDLSFIKRFVLASGSLKRMAQAYGVTYPTIRLRLDRLIAKLEVIDQQQPMSDFERLARAQYADGKIDGDTLRLLMRAHQADLEERDEHSNSP